MTDATASQLETIEAHAWSDMYRPPNPSVAPNGAVGVRDVAGSVWVRHAGLDVLALNRAMALGIGTPLTDDTVAEIVEWYRSGGVPRFFVQIHPLAAAPSIRDTLIQHEIRHYNNWVKLRRDTSDPPEKPSECSVREIGPSDASTFARMACAAFGWGVAAESMVAGLVGRPGWHHYLAEYRGTPVATAAFYAQGARAWLDFASTAEDHRGRGAQSALIRERVRAARALGCTTLVVETAEETETRDAPSFRNVRRLGFEVAYVRPNYIWTRS